MSAANRTSGAAPLAVFFDAVDTAPDGSASPFKWTSGIVQPADPEGSQYSWDFGDPGSGTWTTTGRSKNAATGYTAAHVYESPGTYAAALTVTDTAGATRTYSQTIVVAPFSGTTYYVAANGSDSNKGTDPAAPFATFGRGFSAVNGGANRRLLLRRGDAFSTPGVTITAAGPGLIGAYGTGPRPILNVTRTDGGILITAPDWRIVDLELVGPGIETDQAAAVGYSNTIQTVNALVLRVRATKFRVGLGNGDWKPIYATPHDGNAWVECEVTTEQAGGIYAGGRRLAILGNDLHDMTHTHALRVWQAHKAVISDNRLWNPGATRHALKLHGPSSDSGRPETRWVTVTDNLVRGKTWAMAIGPQDGDQDERVSHVLVERNRTTGEPSLQVDLIVWARDVMIRNNLFDGTGASPYYAAARVARRGIEPAPRGIRFLGNTVVRLDKGSEFSAVDVAAEAQEVAVRDNLASAPSTQETRLVSGGAGPSVVSDHNLLTASPRFADPAAGDFGLREGSPAVDAGVALPELRSDFTGAPRPRGAGCDLGAFESR